MTCDDALAPLHDRLDGALAPEVASALEHHLAGCEACRALGRDLDRLRDAARALPREVRPEEDLWPGIAARVARPALAERRAPAWWHRPAMVAAALALVAVGSSAITAAVMRPPTEPPPIGRTDWTVTDAAGAWEQDLDAATAELRSALEARRGELDPATLAVVEDNLRIIDAAIAETRAALAERPDDPELRRGLTLAGERRIALLRHVLALTSSG